MAALALPALSSAEAASLPPPLAPPMFDRGVNWASVRGSGYLDRVIRPYLVSALQRYLGAADDGLLGYVMGHLATAPAPSADELCRELREVLEADAVTVVEGVWQLLTQAK